MCQPRIIIAVKISFKKMKKKSRHFQTKKSEIVVNSFELWEVAEEVLPAQEKIIIIGNLVDKGVKKTGNGKI